MGYINERFGFKLIPLILILLAYSVLSTGTFSGVFTQERLSLIIFMPTILQLLHFYYDEVILKRSDKLVSTMVQKVFGIRR